MLLPRHSRIIVSYNILSSDKAKDCAMFASSSTMSIRCFSAIVVTSCIIICSPELPMYQLRVILPPAAPDFRGDATPTSKFWAQLTKISQAQVQKECGEHLCCDSMLLKSNDGHTGSAFAEFLPRRKSFTYFNCFNQFVAGSFNVPVPRPWTHVRFSDGQIYVIQIFLHSRNSFICSHADKIDFPRNREGF